VSTLCSKQSPRAKTLVQRFARRLYLHQGYTVMWFLGHKEPTEESVYILKHKPTYVVMDRTNQPK